MIETFKLSGEIRWFKEHHKHFWRQYLQQAWVGDKGTIEWRKVELVEERFVDDADKES